MAAEFTCVADSKSSYKGSSTPLVLSYCQANHSTLDPA